MSLFDIDAHTEGFAPNILGSTLYPFGKNISNSLTPGDPIKQVSGRLHITPYHFKPAGKELDYATSGVGTIETGPIFLKDLFDPGEVSTKLTKDKWRLFADSLVLCLFPTMMMPVTPGAPELMVRILNAATGWDFTLEEADLQAHRIANLLRVFNLRHGINTDVEYPSPRYGSTPQDGPAKGMGIMPNWEYMLDNYYKLMGWDRVSGRPLPETLKSMGLEHIINDIW